MRPTDLPYAPVVYAAIYISRAVRPFTEADLADLLFVARRKNAERGITGRLIYAASGDEPGLFAQWIEGEDWRVRELLYTSILTDGRHALVGRPFEGPTARRQFPSWTMGFEQLPTERAVSTEVEALVSLAHTIQPQAKRSSFRLPPEARMGQYASA